MSYEIKNNEDRVIAYCSICNTEIGSWDAEYASNYPNGFDVAVEQEWLHHSKEHDEFDHIISCSNGCGATIGIWDNEYVTRYPNGFDCAVEQEQRNHNRHCPKLWAEWRERNKALEDETPRALIKRIIREGGNPFNITIPPDREYTSYGYCDWDEEIFLLSSFLISVCGLTFGYNPHTKGKFYGKIYFCNLDIPKFYVGTSRKLYFEKYR